LKNREACFRPTGNYSWRTVKFFLQPHIYKIPALCPRFVPVGLIYFFHHDRGAIFASQDVEAPPGIQLIKHVMKSTVKITLVTACLLMSFCIRAQFQFSVNPVWQVSGTYPTGLGWADFDHNGYPDVVVSLGLDVANGPTLIYFNEGGVLPLSPGWVSAFQAPGCGLYVNDFDHNGEMDVAVASLGLLSSAMAPVPNYLFMNQNGMPPDPGWLSAPGNSFSCTGGDIDGDGDIDLAFARGDYATNHKLKVFLFLNSGGVFDSIPDWQSDSAYFGTDCAFADIDQDGDLDLALGARTQGVMVFYSNNGILETSPSWSTNLVSGARQMAFGDPDGDGYPDLAIAAPGGKFYLLKNVNGVLDSIPQWTSINGSEPSAVAWGDADGDGDQDLAAGSWNGPVGIFENTNGILGNSFSWSRTVGSGTQQVAWIDYDNALLTDTVKTLAGPGNKKLFYLGIQPVQQISSVELNGLILPENQYCYDLTDGWVSFAAMPLPGDTLIIHYSYSRSLDLSITTWSTAKLYKNLATTVGVSEGHWSPGERPWLEQNIPNPCRDLTTIGFFLPSGDLITMRLFNNLGKEVWTQPRQFFPAGSNTISVPVCHLAPGLYTYKMEGTDFCLTRKMIVR